MFQDNKRLHGKLEGISKIVNRITVKSGPGSQNLAGGLNAILGKSDMGRKKGERSVP